MSINNTPVDEKDIIIQLNNKPLTFFKKIVKNRCEPILIFMYETTPIQSTDLLTIKYKTLLLHADIEQINDLTQKRDLAITTLFQNDYDLFPCFYNYYTSQGVEWFYMYYNGIITTKIKELFNKPNVTLIEWNFRYWNTNCTFRHHAQLGQMHDALYKYGKSNYNYMIFCDLDEYLHISKTTLLKEIQKGPYDVVGFCNYWSQTLDNKIPSALSTFTSSSNGLPYRRRSKNILRPDSIHLLDIHYITQQNLNIQKCPNYKMYHFYCWSKKNRKFNLDNLELVTIQII
jgi:hypothetical protein